MSFINFAAREINCKIVYYGPGLGGKTTNLQYVYDKTADKQKGKMISLATEADRTLFFDFLPLDLGTVRGFKTRFHLYTVPGQIFYDASRKLILRGVDGVVFVADSQQERMDANLEAMDNLQENLVEHGYQFASIPYVLQLNKRDLPNAVPGRHLARRADQERRAHRRGHRLPGHRRLRDTERNRPPGAGGAEEELAAQFIQTNQSQGAPPLAGFAKGGSFGPDYPGRKSRSTRARFDKPSSRSARDDNR